jgi:hypothetical protein
MRLQTPRTGQADGSVGRIVYFPWRENQKISQNFDCFFRSIVLGLRGELIGGPNVSPWLIKRPRVRLCTCFALQLRARGCAPKHGQHCQFCLTAEQ